MASGLSTLLVGRERLTTLTGTYTRANGAITKQMERAFTRTRLALGTRENGKTINSMVKESKVGPTVHFTRGTTLWAKRKALESTAGLTDRPTRAIGLTTKSKALAPTFGKMAKNAMANGLKVS